ncbi:molecular chaperone TorD family protein [Bacillus mojavensis]|uniref:molecular chaperone TorD family protein n=1 Tax=Bacillus mojavensis TaxID=72360 RepID=UPI00398AF14C
MKSQLSYSIYDKYHGFVITCQPAKDPFQKLSNEAIFQSVCKIIGNAKLISSLIKSLLAGTAWKQKLYKDYTHLFIEPNSLPALLWESVYLDCEP